MPIKSIAIAAAILAFLGVAIGAFAAHGLKARLSSEAHAIFEVGVRYQMYHALGLFAVAWAMTLYPHPLLAWSGWCMIAGTVIFSGSLYALSLSGIKILGAITPIGGVLFLIAWVLLIIGIVSD
jgi:uncharacterized membrane protein YgdD (TMEM256/DUF423 family)